MPVAEKLVAVGMTAITLAGATSPAHAIEFSLDGGLTAVYQDADQVDGEFSASLDVVINAQTASGEWLVFIEAASTPAANGVSATYPTANADAASVLDRDDDGTVQVSEFNYTFRLAQDRALVLGLLDPSAWLDTSDIANDENLHFLNSSFVNNATIELPDYTFGGAVSLPGRDRRPDITVIATSSEGKADVPKRSYRELIDLTADGRGAFLGANASWPGDTRSLQLGVWLKTDDHPVAGRPQQSEMNYGAYAGMDWRDQGHALNLRLGVANDRVSAVAGFLALAYHRETQYGLVGLGVARSFISNRLRESGSAGTRSGTNDAELFLRIPVGDGNAYLTPSIQYVENPTLDESGAPDRDDGIVPGVRFRWDY